MLVITLKKVVLLIDCLAIAILLLPHTLSAISHISVILFPHWLFGNYPLYWHLAVICCILNSFIV